MQKEFSIEIPLRFTSWEDAVEKVQKVLRISQNEIDEHIVAVIVPTPQTVKAAVEALDDAMDKFGVTDMGEPNCGHENCKNHVINSAAQLIIIRKGNWTSIKRDISMYMGVEILDGSKDVHTSIALLRAAKIMLKEYDDHRRQLSNSR